MTKISFVSAAIIGMGRTGCSVSRFLHEQGISCTAFDEHKQVLPDGLGCTAMHAGKIDAGKLMACDCVIVSPGVPWQHPALQKVRDAGMPVIGDLDLFTEHFRGEMLAVTGTNGKTTTISLIAMLLETLPGGIETAGNIGRPMLDLLMGEYAPDRVVLELSSFQLERCKAVHPRWAVLLNIQPDHADMHANANCYEEAKLKLFEQQGDGDTALLPADAYWHDLAERLAARGVIVRRFGDAGVEHLDAGLHIAPGEAMLFWSQEGKRHTVDCNDFKVRGRHQHLNMAVAAQAAADFGVRPTVIREALTSFRGLPHRLQYLGLHVGHEWFNDSKATNPDAAKAALDAFDQVLWICGGLRKGLDMSPLSRHVRRHVAHAFVIGKETGAFASLLDSAGVPFDIAGDLQRAVTMAAEHVCPLPVLLSPAAASQDQFADYAERGHRFTEAVNCLEKAA